MDVETAKKWTETSECVKICDGKCKSQSIVGKFNATILLKLDNFNGKNTFYNIIVIVVSVLVPLLHLVAYVIWIEIWGSKQNKLNKEKKKNDNVHIIEKCSLCEPHNMMTLAEYFVPYHLIVTCVKRLDRPSDLFSSSLYNLCAKKKKIHFAWKQTLSRTS